MSYAVQIFHCSLTTALTTFTLALHAHQAHESSKRKNFRADCGRKVLKNPVTTLLYGFGSRMSQVQILSFRPSKSIGALVAPGLWLCPKGGLKLEARTLAFLQRCREAASLAGIESCHSDQTKSRSGLSLRGFCFLRHGRI